MVKEKNKKISKSGFISIIGRPNTGKSTLLNSILSRKIAITSDKPQTTRFRIAGIKNIDDNQLIFLDTPGIHQAQSKLNKYMVETAYRTYKSVDLILVLVDCDIKSKKHNEIIFQSLENIKTPKYLIINKIDLIQKDKLLPLIENYSKIGPPSKQGKDFWKEIIPISALQLDGIDFLINRIVETLPEGPHFYPHDMSTDQSEKLFVSELIREKAIDLTQQEVPYSIAVLVESIRDGKKNVMVVDAVIYVERESQKGIVIGKKGSLIKEIGTKAKIDMENWFGVKVYLTLFVKVKKEWSKKEYNLKELGYSL
jgi:GTP-binding protein Era